MTKINIEALIGSLSNNTVYKVKVCWENPSKSKSLIFSTTHEAILFTGNKNTHPEIYSNLYLKPISLSDKEPFFIKIEQELCKIKPLCC